MIQQPVICLSSQNWFNDLWTNKQHLMSRLAKQGTHVLYSCKGIVPFWRYFANRATTGTFRGNGIQAVTETLSVMDSPELPLFGLFPFSLRYERFGFKMKQVLQQIQQLDVDPIVWIYHPGYGHYVDLLPDRIKVVYDCVDDYKSFPGSRKKQGWITSGEAKLIARANLVTTTSQALYEDKKSLNPNTHLVHNVGDYAHFSQVDSETFSVPESVATIKGPKIGFFGAISNYKVNLDLLAEVAGAAPDVSLCLMGPTGLGEGKTNIDRLKAISNCHFLGKVEYDDLPQYLQSMDVLMIPYRLSDHTKRVFPIKFFECLATGKPTVVTPLPAYEAYQSHVRVASDSASFLDQIRAVLADPETGKSDRVALAKKYDWSYRLASIVDLIKTTVL